MKRSVQKKKQVTTVFAMKRTVQKKKTTGKMKKVSKQNKGGFSNKWTPKEEAALRKLNTPTKIQEFLDNMAYDYADDYFSARYTLRTRRAHCMGGAILAACCLERIGLGPPRIVGFEAENDDSHAVAVYQKNGYWGALGKSNFTLIRSRDPVYRSLRELMMSYFDFYFNTKRQKSMTHYQKPFNLNRIGQAWKFAEGSLGDKLDDLDDYDKTPLIPVRPPGMRRSQLGLASKHVLNAGLLGSNPSGLYKPR